MNIASCAVRMATALMAVIPLSSVHAASYAVSYSEITGFGLTFVGGTVSFTGPTFSTDTAALNNLASSGSSVSSMDAPATCLNCSYDNSFTTHGASASPGYAYGDAQITNANVLAGTGAASAIGEVGDFNDFAIASGSNTLSGNFSITGGSSLMNIDFITNSYMFTSADAGDESAAANVFMQITVQKKISQVFTTIFSWSPDGTAGGITGGGETSDPFSLNYGIADNSGYNPGSGTFSAYTSALGTGSYKINIVMRNSVEAIAVSPPAEVPLPAALPLFLSGLSGLLCMARRK